MILYRAGLSTFRLTLHANEWLRDFTSSSSSSPSASQPFSSYPNSCSSILSSSGSIVSDVVEPWPDASKPSAGRLSTATYLSQRQRSAMLIKQPLLWPAESCLASYITAHRDLLLKLQSNQQMAEQWRPIYFPDWPFGGVIERVKEIESNRLARAALWETAIALLCAIGRGVILEARGFNSCFLGLSQFRTDGRCIPWTRQNTCLVTLVSRVEASLLGLFDSCFCWGWWYLHQRNKVISSCKWIP